MDGHVSGSSSTSAFADQAFSKASPILLHPAASAKLVGGHPRARQLRRPHLCLATCAASSGRRSSLPQRLPEALEKACAALPDLSCMMADVQRPPYRLSRRRPTCPREAFPGEAGPLRRVAAISCASTTSPRSAAAPAPSLSAPNVSASASFLARQRLPSWTQSAGRSVTTVTTIPRRSPRLLPLWASWRASPLPSAPDVGTGSGPIAHPPGRCLPPCWRRRHRPILTTKPWRPQFLPCAQRDPQSARPLRERVQRRPT
jgi:hypothetical protein